MGKGGRCPETRMGRYARCEAPKPSWGSSDCGGTLESWVLRKAHARFGEGRMEKCSRSNSPAAYSTSITAARRGTSSRISPGSLCPSACVTGLTGSDQRDLVLSAHKRLHRRQAQTGEASFGEGTMQRFHGAQPPGSLRAEDGRTGQPVRDLEAAKLPVAPAAPLPLDPSDAPQAPPDPAVEGWQLTPLAEAEVAGPAP